ncbi:MAG: type IV-A pilus assembly ATPase PilB [Acidobacteria bacterium]|nr:type IV-A pilus assembly ATPase PilB [Acidobacteriota bacterium]
MLIDNGLISEEALNDALEDQAASGERLGHYLVEKNLVQESDLVRMLSDQYGVPAAEIDELEVLSSLLELVPADMARRYLMVPVQVNDKVLEVAMVDPTDVVAMDDLKFATGLRIQPLVASERAVKEAIERLYGGKDDNQISKMMDDLTTELNAPGELEIVDTDENIDLESLSAASGEAPVIKLVNLILTDALRRGASDIHIEPYERRLRVRYRIDGVLYEIMDPPKTMQNALASRIKIMSQLDISERRRPQDGRIKLRVQLEGRLRELDLRVSSLPTIWGEKIVMRLLDPEGLMLDMSKLGFEPWSLQRFQEAIVKPFGIVLVTGPTGSGKTNTLYSAMGNINKPDTNIMTAEDPVEFNLVGINQVQVREEIGLTFATALRSFLRQDPDIVLVGEIRDGETAEIAVKAALTGHLVLSTLHTNDSASTITRLMDMGVAEYLLASTINGVVAQRLVRTLCTDCREPYPVLPEMAAQLDLAHHTAADPVTLYRAVGCETCDGTGFHGRTSIIETLVVDDAVRRLILQRAPAIDIQRAAVERGMRTMHHDGLAKALAGVTTVEEVVRVTREA